MLTSAISLPQTLPSSLTAGGDELSSIQFRDFFQILHRASQLIARVSDVDAPEAAQTLSKDLLQLIELQTLEARRSGGSAAMEYESQARYLKAVLADEILLNSDWAGREHWRHELLEAKLFKSSHAGEQVFFQIDQLLSAREPSQRPLAKLYLYVISLGFKGQFRGDADLSKLASYRNDLFQFIFQRPAALSGAERRLSEVPYDSTLSHFASRRIPKISRWWIKLTLILAGMLVLSELVWLWQSWPVRKSLDITVGSASEIQFPSEHRGHTC